ncbi:MAG: DnaA N-terminal domain-containing protein [Pseudomonadota bacterium]
MALRVTGSSAASAKYDLITAMGSYALALGKTDQRRVLRFLTLIFARYNWQQNKLTVGQVEIAALWSVDPRTVKREMSVLKSKGWLYVKRPGARGRVTEYGLSIDQIFASTQESHSKVGPDFVARMEQTPAAATTTNVITLASRQGNLESPLQSGSEKGEESLWGNVCDRLYAQDAALFQAWFASLKPAEQSQTKLILEAPSKFHAEYVKTHLMGRLFDACQRTDPKLRYVDVVA